MDSIWHIVVSTTCIYLFIILGLRLLGKTELAQLSITDLIFVLLISNAVQNAMVGTDTSLLGGIVAAGVLFILNYIFKILKYKFPQFNNIMEGSPVVLVLNGKIVEENCKKNFITHDDLLQTIREHGSKEVEEVDIAVLEMDGNISVVSNDYKHHSTKRIKRKKKE